MFRQLPLMLLLPSPLLLLDHGGCSPLLVAACARAATAAAPQPPPPPPPQGLCWLAPRDTAQRRAGCIEFGRRVESMGLTKWQLSPVRRQQATHPVKSDDSESGIGMQPSSGRTFYVDSRTGDDTAAGRTPSMRLAKQCCCLLVTPC